LGSALYSAFDVVRSYLLSSLLGQDPDSLLIMIDKIDEHSVSLAPPQLCHFCKGNEPISASLCSFFCIVPIHTNGHKRELSYGTGTIQLNIIVGWPGWEN
jgi:hypothetical protein